MSHFFEHKNAVSWGRTLRATHMVARPVFLDQLPAMVAKGAHNENGLLAIGLGRSYGDSGLNHGGAVIDMTSLNRLIDFDEKTGILRAEAGCSLERILEFSIPRGLFLPVTPGTRYVTLGGAIANDVHGKNHFSAGTIGRWVREIGLLRSDASVLTLNENDKTGLFAATIGGLGLTGVITHVGIELKPISSSMMDVETIKFDDIGEFFALARDSDEAYEHTVSWIDCMARGPALGRGLFMRATHAKNGPLLVDKARSFPDMPMDAPSFALNRLSISAFNTIYYAIGGRKSGITQTSYLPFFYPLDFVGRWNRLYGKRGMYQYQSVVPPAVAPDATREMLEQIAKAGQGSFLVVLKTLGSLPSPGLMSFPREGTTLALDFPNKGKSTLDFLSRLDDIVREAGGRNYPAKDGRVPADMIRDGYPQITEFAKHLDDGISSSFWRRIRGVS